jgi:predicted amidophosphoribosyltransferase
LRAAIRAWKDGGRRDLEAGLSQLLAEVIICALDWQPRQSPTPGAGSPLRPSEDAVLVVPVPSSRRAQRLRGDRPLDRVASRAIAGARTSTQRVVGPVQPLRHRRRVADQAGLGAVSRHANLTGSMEVPAAWRAVVRGRRCLVLDDVITSGSTLSEAARALLDAGALDVRAAVIASTPRRPRDR